MQQASRTIQHTFFAVFFSFCCFAQCFDEKRFLLAYIRTSHNSSGLLCFVCEIMWYCGIHINCKKTMIINALATLMMLCLQSNKNINLNNGCNVISKIITTLTIKWKKIIYDELSTLLLQPLHSLLLFLFDCKHNEHHQSC